MHLDINGLVLGGSVSRSGGSTGRGLGAASFFFVDLQTGSSRLPAACVDIFNTQILDSNVYMENAEYAQYSQYVEYIEIRKYAENVKNVKNVKICTQM